MSYYLMELETDTLVGRDNLIRRLGGIGYFQPFQIFGVVGETKVVIVSQHPLESLFEVSYPVQMTCSPVVNLQHPFEARVEQQGEMLYWINFQVAYERVNMNVFLSELLEGAKYLAKKGKLNGQKIHLFKAVAERRVHMFVRARDHTTIEDVIENLQAMNQLGPNASVVTKTLTARSKHVPIEN